MLEMLEERESPIKKVDQSFLKKISSMTNAEELSKKSETDVNEKYFNTR